MNGYAVFSLADDEGHYGSGLTLTEAFTRMMAFAECDFLFHRVDGVMHLTLHHREELPEEYRRDPALQAHYFPEHRSTLADAMARAEIMRKFLNTGFKGYHIVTDASLREQAAKERAGA